MTYFSKHGYKIDKTNVDFDLSKTKRELTVVPKSKPGYPEIPAIQVYLETEKWIIVPTWYGIETFGSPKTKCISKISSDAIQTFSGVLRESQIEPMKQCLDYLTKFGRGILCLPTGFGKTFCSLYLASKLGQKTLVIVNKTTLLEQWKNEIGKLFPKIKIGIIQQSNVDTECDIVIAMWQTLNSRPTVPGQYGLIILDECHRVSSRVFNSVMFKVNAHFVIGLSATPERQDGLETIMHFHLGNIMYKVPKIERECPPTVVYVAKYNGRYQTIPTQFSTFVSELVKDPLRNKFIADTVQKVFEFDHGLHRQMLILSERVWHVCEIAKLMPNHLVTKTFTGLDKTTLEDVKSANIIVSTFKMFEEGVSVETLNTLLLATPKRNVTQAIGRIFRKAHEIPPMIIDIADCQLNGQLRHRLATYQEQINEVSIVDSLTL